MEGVVEAADGDVVEAGVDGGDAVGELDGLEVAQVL